MNPRLIPAAIRLQPQLIAAARRGQKPRQIFKRSLRARQATLSFKDWYWLLVTLEALSPRPAIERLVHTSLAPVPSRRAFAKQAPK